MNKYDLSILIPARNEMFLAKTVETLLKSKKGKTEILVGLDGEWANPGIPDHEDVTILYSPEPLGQRGMTNQLCRLSQAKYVMKLDAHCILDEGFDLKMIAEMQDDYTMIPTMYNLHAFDWVCIGKNQKSGKIYFDPEEGKLPEGGCGHAIYQGPTPEKCPKCGGNMERWLVWQPRLNRKSNYYRFDKTLHFQYWGDYGKREEAKKDVCELMTIQGSCFMLTREKYWELDICEEAFGSWGQQGVEVACKTWFSGGKVMVNKKTWYSHMFRTQGGDFGFPYPLSGGDVEKARKYSRWLIQDGNFKKALPGRDLNWLLDKFYPVPDWHDGVQGAVSKVTGNNLEPTRNIIYYTDNQLNVKIASKVQKQLMKMELPIISASLKPMPHFGQNIHIPLKRGVETYFTQIIKALETSRADIVYFAEHDVLYHPSHFTFIPERKDMFYYNQNFWRVREDGFSVHWDANQVSGLVCYRKHALQWYQKKFNEILINGFNRSYEPGGRDKSQYEVFFSEFPNVDIRHEGTLTKSKWSPNDFRDKSTCVNWQEGRVETIPGWNFSKENFLSCI